MKRDELAARVEHWRRLLAPEWRITLVKDPPDEEDLALAHAAIQPAEHVHHADLWLSPTRCSLDLAELDVTIVHELLHLALLELRRPLDVAVDQLAHSAGQLAARMLNSEEERVVERLARVIARLEHPDGIVYGTDGALAEEAA